jgi:hypothetical protein
MPCFYPALTISFHFGCTQCFTSMGGAAPTGRATSTCSTSGSTASTSASTSSTWASIGIILVRVSPLLSSSPPLLPILILFDVALFSKLELYVVSLVVKNRMKSLDLSHPTDNLLFYT